ncbi:MAG: glycosyltransferase family 39 protein [Acidobacteria bacterium]|nr:glycosyltransferase family 39 protein [Acidobacteriota bacterium]
MSGAGSIDARSRTPWIALATIAVAVIRFLTRQQTHWELDEYLFRMGVQSFEPLLHHPHPPGYPLLIGLAQLIDRVLHDPFVSLIALAWVSSVIGTFAFASALRELTRSDAIAVVGALLFNLSPAMLVHGPEPMSDAPALMFLSLAFLAVARTTRSHSGWWLAGFAASCAASIGCRPQYAIPIVPVFLVVIALRGSARAKLAAFGTFTAVCLIWLLPLVVAIGGLERFIEWETGQAAYVAAHDAHLSRGTRSWAEIALRFVAHPWGSKGLAIPTLALALVGAVEIARRRMIAAWPLLAVSALHLVITIATTDPADGVRYQLPAQMAIAFAAAIGIDAIARVARLRTIAALIPISLLLGYWLYARPVVIPRATEPSPPARAIAWANAALPKETVVLCDLPLRPHAEATLEGVRALPVEPGLASVYDEPGTAVWVLADGLTGVPGSRSFSWPYSDAYGKLTRNHYRVVSMIPLTPERRFLAVKGVNPWERDADRPEWRWLPKEVPYESSRITVKVDGSAMATVEVARGASSEVVVSVPDGRYAGVDIVSSQAFTPAAVAGRDPRRLAITLTDLTRVPRGAGDEK